MCNVPKPIHRINSQPISLSDATNTTALKAKNNTKKRPSSSSASASSSSSHHHHHYPHIKVQHNYHDRSEEAKPADMDLAHELTVRCSATSPFPIKLYSMLSRVEQDGFGHVVSWQPHGRCFMIHNNKEFTALLPRYFKLSKIASFQRQLNLYGFQRITQGLDKGSYYHEYFLRSKEYLAYKILRIKVKGTGVRGKSNPEQEPNFWSMPWVGGDNDKDMPRHAASQEQVANLQATIARHTRPNNNNNNNNNSARQASTSATSHETQASPVISAAKPQHFEISEDVATVPTSIHIPRRYSDMIVSSHRQQQQLQGPQALPRRAVSAPLPSSSGNTRLLWGMPFQALDHLPDTDLEANQQSAPPAAAAKETTRRTSTSFTLDDLDDQLYLDQCLNSMVREYCNDMADEEPSQLTSATTDDLAEILDMIVSAN